MFHINIFNAAKVTLLFVTKITSEDVANVLKSANIHNLIDVRAFAIETKNAVRTLAVIE